MRGLLLMLLLVHTGDGVNLSKLGGGTSMLILWRLLLMHKHHLLDITVWIDKLTTTATSLINRWKTHIISIADDTSP